MTSEAMRGEAPGAAGGGISGLVAAIGSIAAVGLGFSITLPLLALTLEDRDAVVAAAADGGLTELFFTNVSGLADPDKFLAAAFRERDYGRAMPFAVETPDGRVVGLTRLMRMHEQHRRVEIGGTFYARSVQRTGVNTEAKKLLLTHAFVADAIGRIGHETVRDAFEADADAWLEAAL